MGTTWALADEQIKKVTNSVKNRNTVIASIAVHPGPDEAINFFGLELAKQEQRDFYESSGNCL